MSDHRERFRLLNRISRGESPETVSNAFASAPEFRDGEPLEPALDMDPTEDWNSFADGHTPEEESPNMFSEDEIPTFS